MVTGISTNQMFRTTIRPLVLLFFSGCFTIFYICLSFFFLRGLVWGGGVIYGCSVQVDTHTHTLSQDERAVTLPANMILQPWVEWVVEERMRTGYKRGKPLDLQVPAVRMQTMQQHTFLELIFFFLLHQIQSSSEIRQMSLRRKTTKFKHVSRNAWKHKHYILKGDHCFFHGSVVFLL